MRKTVVARLALLAGLSVVAWLAVSIGLPGVSKNRVKTEQPSAANVGGWVKAPKVSLDLKQMFVQKVEIAADQDLDLNEYDGLTLLDITIKATDGREDEAGPVLQRFTIPHARPNAPSGLTTTFVPFALAQARSS